MAEIKMDFLDDDEFDPLEVDDLDIDQENMDDDNPLDTIDYPTVRNMPEELTRKAVYTPEQQGGVQAALAAMLDRNPARRQVLLSIIGWCEGGCATSVLSEKVDELQKNNRSVYAPTTLARMLERAGALELEVPEPAQAREDVEEGVEYLEIGERVDPVWRATAEGLAAREALGGSAAFRDIVFDRDARYIRVYAAVMLAAAVEPRTHTEIEEIADAFPEVKSPRRFGGHFIDMLERTDAFEWNGQAWQLTEMGRELLPEVEERARAAKTGDDDGKEA